jgi:4-amino-4-deoxy-L-arabinose transferase-like glycosyltransferase
MPPETPSPPPSPPLPGARLLWLTLAGLLLRLAFVLLEPSVPPVADERTWTNWALEVLLSERVALDPLKTRMIFYPPLYPYFIALVWLPFRSLMAVQLAQVLVSAALIPAVGRVAARWLGPRAGLVAAAITAIDPVLIWFSAHFWSETLFLAILWWGFERLLEADRRHSAGLALAAGLLFGVSILTRETALYFAPLAALWLGWGRRRHAWARGAVFLLATVAVVAPWTWRNARVFDGAFVPVSTAGGLNLWQGNAPISRYEVYVLYDQVGGRVNQYRYARQRGLELIWERQPWWIFEKLRDEMPHFWETENQAMIHIQRGAYGPMRPLWAASSAAVTVLPWLAVLGLFALGLARLQWDRRALLLLGFLVFHNALHVVTHGFARYRLPVMPVVFAVAALAFLAWRDRAPPLVGPRRLAAGLLLALAALLVAPSLASALRHPAYDLRAPLELRHPRTGEPAQEAPTPE